MTDQERIKEHFNRPKCIGGRCQIDLRPILTNPVDRAEKMIALRKAITDRYSHNPKMIERVIAVTESREDGEI